ncbi:hypothetical protein MKX01_012494 [Papaver californicum]|nr:hypothetical protein MKX01_012494 [Papaver californicum]
MDGNCLENPLYFLTEDLLIEILLWLPVVSLLRLGLGQWSYKNLGISPHLIDDADDEFDIYDRYPQANMVGSCHDIICIHDPHEFGGILTDFVMFGFDCETYDYKVVQITFSENGVLPKNEVQIYSLLSDSWRWCRYLNGCYYFLGNNFHIIEMINDSALHLEPVLLSFNFSRESFRMITGPHEYSGLDVIGGDQGKIVFVAWISNSIAEYTSDTYEVYALNDYDYSCSAASVENYEYSWSKINVFHINHPYGRYGPRAITKNGVLGFVRGYGGGLVFINSLTEEMKDIEIIDGSLEGLGDVFGGDVYKESLVSIDSALPATTAVNRNEIGFHTIHNFGMHIWRGLACCRVAA